MSSVTSTTFPVSDRKANEYGGSTSAEPSKDDIIYLKAYDRHYCDKVLLMSEFPKNSELSDQSFVNTVVDAYSYHHNLVIRPDDVWAALMTQFSFYIKTAENLRDKFVNFGKETVAVAVPGALNDLTPAEFQRLMSTVVDANITDPDLKKWIFPKFTTTTEIDTVAVGIQFMSSTKEDKEKLYLGCGIPNVTLEGSAEDWETMLANLEKLKDYNLEKWYDLLKPVIQQFLNAKRGTVDTVFWQRICHYEANASATSYLSGWITVFCPYDRDGNWIESNWNTAAPDANEDSSSDPEDDDTIVANAKDDDDEDRESDSKMDENLKDWLRIDMEKMPNGPMEVSLEIKDGNDAVFQTVLMAGHMGLELKEDKVTIQPVMGWAVSFKGSADEDDSDGDGNMDNDGSNGNDKDDGDNGDGEDDFSDDDL